MDVSGESRNISSGGGGSTRKRSIGTEVYRQDENDALLASKSLLTIVRARS